MCPFEIRAEYGLRTWVRHMRLIALLLQGTKAFRNWLTTLRHWRRHDGPRSGTMPTEPEGHAETPKKRGRKRTFTDDQLLQALEMKLAGKTNNEIAKVLYGT